MARYGQPWCMALGPYFCDNPHHALLHHVLGGHSFPPLSPEQPMMREGIGLEFGVGNGDSLRCIARFLPIVIGYDSFQGLPEDWRPGFEQGTFACDPPTRLPDNADVVVGMFDETVPKFDPHLLRTPVSLLHIDCDLYSSTKTVLERCERLMTPGLVIVFDEWWGYPGCEDHEQRAWREFTAAHRDLEWEVIGHGVQQWAVRLA